MLTKLAEIYVNDVSMARSIECYCDLIALCDSRLGIRFDISRLPDHQYGVGQATDEADFCLCAKIDYSEAKPLIEEPRARAGTAVAGVCTRQT